jgi:hypothetical protein
MTIRTRTFLLLLLLCAATSIHAQRWDNYRPDNRKVALDSTNMPIVLINTDGQMILRDERITARMKILYNEDGSVNYRDTVAHPNQTVHYDGYIALKYRGNSSFNSSDKKPYSIKLIETPLEEGGEKRKERLLGMGKDNDWAMLAPYSDRSMIRDVLAFTLAKPYFDYTPSARHCELILDGVYYGVYVLTERLTKGKNRLNLDDPGNSGDELTGGYLVQVDRDDEPHIYISKHHPESPWGEMSWNYIHYQYKHPEFEEMNYTQRRYLQNRIDAMENSLASANYKDESTGYRRYLDVTSFIDYELSTEFSHNVDGYRLSTNMFKWRDSKDARWKLAIWDINLGFGNADYYEGSATDTWVYKQNDIMAWQDDCLIPFWWDRLMKDDSYVAELKSRWTKYRMEFYSDSHVAAVVDSLYDVLTCMGAEQRNSKAWPRWGRYLWPNEYVSTSISDEFNYLRGWISDRLAYMDSQWFDLSGIGEVSAVHHAPTVWPQPARTGGVLHVSTDGPDHLQLFSTDGKVFVETSTEGEVCEMSLSGVSPGLYILHSKSGNLKIIVRP